MKLLAKTHAVIAVLTIAAAGLAAGVAAAETPPGHSHQGPAFDHGPRQFAEINGTSGPIRFAEESCSDDARAFINQGIGQLHGFLNFESERSFRQAAYIEPSCAMAYWGMAMANVIWATNEARALEFVRNAAERLNERNSDRERRYIGAIETLQNDRSGLRFALKLREIWQRYPDDLDAKAFFVMTVWWKNLHAQVGYGGSTVRERNWPLYQLAKQILAVEPLHPVHHYVIHMWDNEHFAYALDAADHNGFAAPGIAHMWHMAGHTYNQAGMLFERWWSQEAAARVDHSYMKKAQVFPFMLHNHAHNNEWFSRTLQEVGDFEKSMRVAANLLAQPRHPTFNHVAQYQHLQSGVNRVLDGIDRGGYWVLGKNLFASPLLECATLTAHDSTYQKCLRVRALTAVMTGSQPSDADLMRMNTAFANEVRLVTRLARGQAPSNVITQLSSLQHLSQDAWGFHALARYARAAGRSRDLLARARTFLGPVHVNVPAMLEAAYVLKKSGANSDADALMERVRAYSQEVDFDAPSMREVAASFSELGVEIGSAWRQDFALWRAVHANRPMHDDLGPLMWQVPSMPNISFTDINGVQTNLQTALADGPAVLVFSLATCQHCDLQLQDLLQRQTEMAARGVRLIALLSTPENLAAFHEAGVFDEFESIPLHGLFILGPSRQILWQDIAADVFSDVDFVVNELERALHPLVLAGFEGRWDLMPNSHQ